MKTAIILHGMPLKDEYYDDEAPSPSNHHWLPWVQKQLLLKNILAQTLELPKPYEPVYEEWAKVFNQLKVDDETILIGHSCGAGFLVRWLSENKVRSGKVALVAPFLDPENEIKSEFFNNFEIDSKLKERTGGISIFYSVDDWGKIITSVNQIRDSIPGIELKEFLDRGHFITVDNIKADTFPELLKWLLE